MILRWHTMTYSKPEKLIQFSNPDQDPAFLLNLDPDPQHGTVRHNYEFIGTGRFPTCVQNEGQPNIKLYYGI